MFWYANSRVLLKLSLVVGSLAMGGCFMFGGAARTPMPTGEVESLTTCKTGDLDKIKKNLMLAGYGIQSADGETVQTEFKQAEAGYGGKSFLRITAVKVGDEVTKFKVRVRTETREQVETGTLKDSSGRTIATDSTLVEDKNEADEAYYVEMKEVYQKTHTEVCGGA